MAFNVTTGAATGLALGALAAGFAAANAEVLEGCVSKNPRIKNVAQINNDAPAHHVP
jgi:hypothetical protein